MTAKIRSGTGFMSYEEFCNFINGAMEAGDKLQAEVDAGVSGAKEYQEMINKPIAEQ